MKDYKKQWLGYMALWSVIAFFNAYVVGKSMHIDGIPMLKLASEMLELLCFTLAWVHYAYGLGIKRGHKEVKK